MVFDVLEPCYTKLSVMAYIVKKVPELQPVAHHKLEVEGEREKSKFLQIDTLFEMYEQNQL